MYTSYRFPVPPGITIMPVNYRGHPVLRTNPTLRSSRILSPTILHPVRLKDSSPRCIGGMFPWTFNSRAIMLSGTLGMLVHDYVKVPSPVPRKCISLLWMRGGSPVLTSVAWVVKLLET